jgi:hypothetical protein
MSLPYSLYENPFRKKEYMATPRPRRIYKLKDLAKRMEPAYGRRFSETELLNFFEFLSREVEDILQEGSSIHLPLVKISASISGKFKDTQDKFDARRHKVEVNVNPGPRLKGMAKGIKTTKVMPSQPHPCIKEVHDLVQDCKNTALTIGHPAKLFGIHLKLNEADPRQGIFFINEEKQAFPATNIYHNTPSRLFFKVPEALAPGIYKLEVRAIVGNSTEVRTGAYGKPLTLSVLDS